MSEKTEVAFGGGEAAEDIPELHSLELHSLCAVQGRGWGETGSAERRSPEEQQVAPATRCLPDPRDPWSCDSSQNLNLCTWLC